MSASAAGSNKGRSEVLPSFVIVNDRIADIWRRASLRVTMEQQRQYAVC
jgi:hypothetical protein